MKRYKNRGKSFTKIDGKQPLFELKNNLPIKAEKIPPRFMQVICVF